MFSQLLAQNCDYLTHVKYKKLCQLSETVH